jgi:trimethylamine--corrinoid protein Co-methyltransferase
MDHPQSNVTAYTGPFFRGMTDDQCRLIHCASLDILERTGVLLYHQPALDLFRKAGCRVDGNHVRFPVHLIEWALRTAPSRIMMYNRFGRPVMPLGDRIATFGTGSDCLHILDYRDGQRRRAVLQDVVDGLRVAEALPNIDFVMSMFLPSDAPEAAEVRQMEVMLSYSAKPICFVTYEWEGMAEIVAMLEAAVDGAEELRSRPTAILYLNPTTAFRHNEGALRKLMYAAEKHLPCIYLPDVQRGLSCPITFAGAMACHNAGQLVGVALSQLVSEGAPIILNSAHPSTIDMKTMVIPYAEPEGRMYDLDLNSYYRLPVFTTSGADSKLLDEQAVMEVAFTLFAAAVRGGNMIHDLGYLESGQTGSLELLVIADEMVSWLKRYLQGPVINEETLAMEVIHENALKGDFLQTDHTLRHVREGWRPGLLDRRAYDRWVAAGATSMRRRAAERIEAILGSEPAAILSRDTQNSVHSIAELAIAGQIQH